MNKFGQKTFGSYRVVLVDILSSGPALVGRYDIRHVGLGRGAAAEGR